MVQEGYEKREDKYIHIDDYREWVNGDQILIDSGTGTGKTTFVFQTLAAEAKKNHKYLVYICNRKILRLQQFNKYFFDESVRQNVLILTYQYLESTNSFPILRFDPNKNPNKNPNKKGLSTIEQDIIKFNHIEESVVINEVDVMYYVFDEAHYFCSDALFNERVSFWYNAELKFEKSITVFLTATSEPLLLFLKSKRFRDVDFFLELKEEIKYKKTPIKIDPAIYDEYDYDGVDAEFISNYINGINEANAKRKQDSYYHTIIEYVYNAIDIKNHNLRHYCLKPNYFNYKPIYFDDYSDLYVDIVNSEEKWLIFVDSKEDGMKLEMILNELYRFHFHGSDIVKRAVFISADIGVRTDREAYKEFKNINSKEMFECNVLIATSVIDNGINIDPVQCSDMMNVVVSQIEKTAFLQMLGRRRFLDNEVVNLYIRTTDIRRINTLKYELEKLFVFFMYFCLADEIKYVRTRRPTKYSDGMEAVNVLSDSLIETVIGDFPKYSKYFIKSDIHSGIKSNHNNSIFDNYRINIACMMSNFYRYYQFFEVSHESSTSLNILQKQLEWIDSTYNTNNWYKFSKNMSALMDLLSEFSRLGWFKGDEQLVFRKRCRSLVYDFPKEVLPEKLKKEKFRYNNNTLPLPQFKKLNDIFEHFDLPYRIIKEKSYKNKKKINVWKIEKIKEQGR